MAKNGGCFIGSAYSCIDILAYLYNNIFDIEKIKNIEKDRDILLLSKGHAVAALYAVLAQVGIISKDRLKNYLTVDDDLYFHPNPNIPGIEFHSGSMGHGLSIGIGMAFASKLNKINNRIFVVLGDGELNLSNNPGLTKAEIDRFMKEMPYNAFQRTITLIHNAK